RLLGGGEPGGGGVSRGVQGAPLELRRGGSEGGARPPGASEQRGLPEGSGEAGRGGEIRVAFPVERRFLKDATPREALERLSPGGFLFGGPPEGSDNALSQLPVFLAQAPP